MPARKAHATIQKHKKLKENDLVEVRKVIINSRPTTIALLTAMGRLTLEEYSTYLSNIVERMVEE